MEERFVFVHDCASTKKNFASRSRQNSKTKSASRDTFLAHRKYTDVSRDTLVHNQRHKETYCVLNKNQAPDSVFAAMNSTLIL